MMLAGCATTTPSADTMTWSDTTVSAQTGTSQTTAPTDAIPAKDDYRVITVDAKRWEYTPNLIKVKKGEKIKIKINNIDTDHDAEFINMKTQTDKDGLIIIDTSTVGTFTFKCADFCGEWHRDMKGTLIVE